MHPAFRYHGIVKGLVAPLSTPAIATTALSKRFGATSAVSHLTFVVPAASVVLVLGPNGSGKTTLLRLLATALRPTSGRSAIFGYDLVQQADAVRTLAAFLGMSPGLYDALTATENLQFAAAMCGRPREPISPWLERVGLAGTGEHLLRTFSHGMKRRLALARAWLAAPSLLLLDEPFVGLDPEGVQVVHAMISETTQRGGSVIMATHEWERAIGIADTVLVLSAGRMAEFAPAPQFLADTRVTVGGRR